jgi:hypothetical protein
MINRRPPALPASASIDRMVPEHSSSLCGIALNSAAIEFVRFAAISPSHIGQVIKNAVVEIGERQKRPRHISLRGLSHVRISTLINCCATAYLITSRLYCHLSRSAFERTRH